MHGADPLAVAAADTRGATGGPDPRQGVQVNGSIRFIKSRSQRVALAPQDNLVEVVAGGDHSAGHQEQDLLERVSDAPALALVVQLGKVPEQDRHSVRGESHLHRLAHWGLVESEPRRDSPRQFKTRVNPNAPPVEPDRILIQLCD